MHFCISSFANLCDCFNLTASLGSQLDGVDRPFVFLNGCSRTATAGYNVSNKKFATQNQRFVLMLAA